MCLGIPGKVVETYREHDVLMGRLISAAFSNVSVWNMCRRCNRAPTLSCTLVLP